ncbi:MAG: hypothetical protein MI717_04665 [Spirochaetales bacterium]|nr:hypothetical protein [Spirochaetales bacterium]
MNLQPSLQPGKLIGKLQREQSTSDAASIVLELRYILTQLGIHEAHDLLDQLEHLINQE